MKTVTQNKVVKKKLTFLPLIKEIQSFCQSNNITYEKLTKGYHPQSGMPYVNVVTSSVVDMQSICQHIYNKFMGTTLINSPRKIQRSEHIFSINNTNYNLVN